MKIAESFKRLRTWQKVLLVAALVLLVIFVFGAIPPHNSGWVGPPQG